MTTFICFLTAMIFLYIIRLLIGGFNSAELLSFFIMTALLGTHVYLSTRKRAVFGIVIPLCIAASFYPIYQLLSPDKITSIVLIGLYVIALGSCLYIWYRARKDNNS